MVKKVHQPKRTARDAEDALRRIVDELDVVKSYVQADGISGYAPRLANVGALAGQVWERDTVAGLGVVLRAMRVALGEEDHLEVAEATVEEFNGGCDDEDCVACTMARELVRLGGRITIVTAE